MNSYQLQQILMMAGIGLIVAGVGLALIAAYMYFKYNIPDIYADLSGKKRAEGIARKMAEQASGRQRGRSDRARKSERTLAAGATTGTLGTGSIGATSGSLASQSFSGSVSRTSGDIAPSQKEPVDRLMHGNDGPASWEAESVTTVMADDDGVTTVLTAEAAEAAALTVDEAMEPEPEVSEVIEVAEPQEAAVEEVRTEHEPVQQRYVPEYFHIVQRIVLTESTGFVRVEQGVSQ